MTVSVKLVSGGISICLIGVRWDLYLLNWFQVGSVFIKLMSVVELLGET